MFEERRTGNDTTHSGTSPVSEGQKPTHTVAGESFDIEEDRGEVILTHRQWSLAGRGKDVAAAEADLFNEACDLAEVFLSIPTETLDENAGRLREFLLKIAG